MVGKRALPSIDAKVVDRLKAIPRPGMIFRGRLNYHDHDGEQTGDSSERPFLFVKAPMNVTGTDAPVGHSADIERVDYVDELGVEIAMMTDTVAPG